jgi:hypothetical protein
MRLAFQTIKMTVGFSCGERKTAMQAWVQISNQMETISLVVRLGGFNEANHYLLWISTLVLSQVVQAGKFPAISC